MVYDLSKRTLSQKNADRETLSRLSLKELRKRQDSLIPLQRLSFEKYEKARLRHDKTAEKAAIIERGNIDEREEDLIEAIMIREKSQRMKKNRMSVVYLVTPKQWETIKEKGYVMVTRHGVRRKATRSNAQIFKRRK